MWQRRLLTYGMGWKSALRMRSNMSCIRFTPWTLLSCGLRKAARHVQSASIPEENGSNHRKRRNLALQHASDTKQGRDSRKVAVSMTYSITPHDLRSTDRAMRATKRPATSHCRRRAAMPCIMSCYARNRRCRFLRKDEGSCSDGIADY